MTPEQIEELGPAFANYLQQFLFCCNYTQTFDLLGVYCRGLLSDLDRKTCEPIALRAGVAVRTLQEFLRDYGWSFDRTRTTLQQHVATQLAVLPGDELGTLGIADDTGTLKKGRCTPGVQRQHCGEVGKIDNCIVTVHVGVSRGPYQTLIDADLFLPQSWDADRERCRKACIPDDVIYRPKWQIALGQIDRARANGIAFDWFTFDEAYGDKPGFLQGLQSRQIRYVGEVPRSFRCWGSRPRGQQKRSRADELVRHSAVFHSQAWQRVALPRQTLGDQEWEGKAARVWLAQPQAAEAATHWLIWARNVRTGEEKYFVANASTPTPLAVLLRVAFRRWPIEHGFRVSKSEIGFRHFEGRSYVALMRHQVLCLLTLTFVADHTQRLRGEKPGGDGRAGVPGPELGVRGLAGAAAADEPTAIHIESHLLPPAA